MTEHPWRDEDTLHRLHWNEGMSYNEMADELGCSQSCITKWMNKLGVESRPSNREIDRPWNDKDKLHRLYIKDELSTHKIADKFDTSSGVIRNHLDKFDIPIRTKSEASKLNDMPPELVETGAPEWYYQKLRESPANYRMNEKGHMIWRISDDGVYRGVAVHQLIAIANGEDIEKVFSGGSYNCHHKNEIPWDNRPENIELIPTGEHRRIHQLKTNHA